MTTKKKIICNVLYIFYQNITKNLYILTDGAKNKKQKNKIWNYAVLIISKDEI